MTTQSEAIPSRQAQIDQLERQQLITQQKIARLQENYQATQTQIESLRSTSDELSQIDQEDRV